jgi:hypothetical protein
MTQYSTAQSRHIFMIRECKLSDYKTVSGPQDGKRSTTIYMPIHGLMNTSLHNNKIFSTTKLVKSRKAILCRSYKSSRFLVLRPLCCRRSCKMLDATTHYSYPRAARYKSSTDREKSPNANNKPMPSNPKSTTQRSTQHFLAPHTNIENSIHPVNNPANTAEI